ncbi:MAG: rhomboid family intramembrane serine protease [Myxococcales bacterium]|nr:rhomboid family intramembrane serine protease [Myxococcales bacterium]
MTKKSVAWVAWPLGLVALWGGVAAVARAAADGPAEAAWLGGALVPAVMADASGEWWRLGTAGLLHVRPGHLLLNAVALLAAAGAGRHLLAGARLVGVWGLGAVIASGASLLLTRSWSAGASGGVAAVLGALVVLASRRWPGLDAAGRRGALLATVPWLAGLALAELAGPTDRAAHLGGLVAGAALARLPGRPLALVAAGILSVSSVFAVVHALRPLPATWPPAGFHATEGPPPCGAAWTDGLAITCALPAPGPVPPGAEAIDDPGPGHRWPLPGHPHTVWQLDGPGGTTRVVVRPDTPRGRRLVRALAGAPSLNPVH